LDNFDFIESKLVLVYGSKPDLGLFLNKDADAYRIAAAGIEIPRLLGNQPGLPKLTG
jgi:hypothetical protein